MQFDLFAAGGFGAVAVQPATAAEVARPVADLGDEALIAAIPDASLAMCRGLTEEAARRRLSGAIPALAALCRRFKGFGIEKPVPEQVDSLRALAGIGGREAAGVVGDLISGGVVQGPGIAVAVEVARRLGNRLPAAVGLGLLKHPDPAVRGQAAGCVQVTADVAAVLVDLLGDLNAGVAAAAACALGRSGRVEARPVLIRLVAERPSAEAIEALGFVADEASVVLLGRIARGVSEFAGLALAVLEEIEGERAAAVVAGIRRTRGCEGA